MGRASSVDNCNPNYNPNIEDRALVKDSSVSQRIFSDAISREGNKTTLKESDDTYKRFYQRGVCIIEYISGSLKTVAESFQSVAIKTQALFMSIFSKEIQRDLSSIIRAVNKGDLGLVKDLVENNCGLMHLQESYVKYYINIAYKKSHMEVFDYLVEYLKKEYPQPSDKPLLFLNGRDLIDSVKALYGKKATTKGICSGFAIVGLCYFLSGNLDEFDQLIAGLDSLTIQCKRKGKDLSLILKQCEEAGRKEGSSFVKELKEVFTKEGIIVPKDCSIVGLVSLFEGFQMGQEGPRYPHLLSEKGSKITSNAASNFSESIMNIIAPKALEAKGSLVDMPGFGGVYTIGELMRYSESLQDTLDQDPVSIEPIALKLMSNNHTIAIGYDPKEKTWIYMRATDPCKRKIETISEIVGCIEYEFSTSKLPDKSYPLATKICVMAKDEQEKGAWEAKVSSWKESKEFKKIHEIEKCTDLQKEKRGMWLQIAIIAGDIQTAKALIEDNVDVNYQDKEGRSLLLLAAIIGEAKIIEKLIAAKVDIHKKYKGIISPLAVAMYMGHTEIVAALRKAGAKLTSAEYTFFSLKKSMDFLKKKF